MITHHSITRRSLLELGAGFAGIAAVPGLANAQTPPRKGGVLRVSVDQSIEKLNPFHVRVAAEALLAELVYSGLTRLGYDMAAEPDLAESWTNSPDLLEWTFKVRSGVRFHDGTDCTADDVAASFQAILDPATASPARLIMGPITGVAAKDPSTVVFKLSSPFADLPVTLANANARIVPKAIALGGQDRLAREAIGTGPFKLRSFEPERIVSVVRNENYYDPARPYVDRVDVVVYPDPTSEGSALIAGDVDIMTIVQPSEYTRIARSSGVDALRVPSGQFCNVNFGCDKTPFSDVRVRQALALTVDRKAMVDLVAEGFGTPGNDTPLNSAYFYYTDTGAKAPDIAQAKALLAQAGHANGLKLTVTASDKPALRTQMAVALREMAKPAGFDINVSTIPHATYLEQVWKKGDFYIGYYSMQPTADAQFSLLYTSNAPWNETRWNNKEFDELVSKARQTTDTSRRRELYKSAQEAMAREIPSIIPVFFDLLAAKRNWVQGYKIHPRSFFFRLDYVSLAKDAPVRR